MSENVVKGKKENGPWLEEENGVEGFVWGLIIGETGTLGKHPVDRGTQERQGVFLRSGLCVVSARSERRPVLTLNCTGAYPGTTTDKL